MDSLKQLKIILSKVWFYAEQIIRGAIILGLAFVGIYVAFHLIDAIIAYTTTSTTLAVAYSSILLVVVTLLLVIITYYNAEKEHRRDFIRKQLEEFYDPLLYYFTTKKIFKEDYNDIDRILMKKSYLAKKENESSIPFLFSTEVVPLPNDIVMSGTVRIPYEGWFFNSQETLDKWIGIFEKLKDDRIDLANRYREINGDKVEDSELTMPNHNFSLNRMT
jgi:TM2 domain-containing membrane protein YozV